MENKKIKKEHFSNLVAVAHADGKYTEDEMEFLSEKAEDFGLSEEDVKEIMDNADQLHFKIPLNDVDKEEQLSDVVCITMIDGHVDEREYNLCLKIAEKLDFDKKYLDHIIKLTTKLWK